MFVTFAAAAPAAAQARLTGGFAAGFGQDQVAPSGSVSLGYDLKPNFGVELEFAVVSGLGRTLNLPTILGESFSPLVFPTPDFRSDTRIISFSANVVGRLGPPEHKVSPFVVLGGGTANVRRDVGFPRFLPDFNELIPDIGERPTALLLPYPSASSFSENAFMATVGGGLDIGLTSRLSAGVDVRYQHVFSDGSINGIGLTRVGGRFTFKF
jgi:opacity protein-like surface antigen